MINNMNLVQKEVASTSCCKDKDCDTSICGIDLKKNWIWILVVFVILCCCGGNFGGAGGCCYKSDKCCYGGNSSGFTWVWILLLVLCACSVNGIGGRGLLGNAGNVNTNVINVQADEGYADDDLCC